MYAAGIRSRSRIKNNRAPSPGARPKGAPRTQGRQVMPLGGAVEVVDLIADQGQDGQLGHLAAAALG